MSLIRTYMSHVSYNDVVLHAAQEWTTLPKRAVTKSFLHVSMFRWRNEMTKKRIHRCLSWFLFCGLERDLVFGKGAPFLCGDE